MSLNVIKPNFHIVFSIIQNSDIDVLKTELSYIIGSGRVIIIWSKT